MRTGGSILLYPLILLLGKEYDERMSHTERAVFSSSSDRFMKDFSLSSLSIGVQLTQ